MGRVMTTSLGPSRVFCSPCLNGGENSNFPPHFIFLLHVGEHGREVVLWGCQVVGLGRVLTNAQRPMSVVVRHSQMPCSPRATSINVVSPGMSLSSSATPGSFRFASTLASICSATRVFGSRGSGLVSTGSDKLVSRV
jgi:hypothetical protein